MDATLAGDIPKDVVSGHEFSANSAEPIVEATVATDEAAWQPSLRGSLSDCEAELEPMRGCGD